MFELRFRKPYHSVNPTTQYQYSTFMVYEILSKLSHLFNTKENEDFSHESGSLLSVVKETEADLRSICRKYDFNYSLY